MQTGFAPVCDVRIVWTASSLMYFCHFHLRSSLTGCLHRSSENAGKKQAQFRNVIYLYYIDTDEIPGFLLLLKNHILTARSEDTIFIFHVWGYWCGHGYQHNYPITIELLAQARGRLIWNFIHKMASRCEDGRVIEFFSSLLEFWLFRTENISIIFFISPL